MNQSDATTESLIEVRPITVRRIVRWSECDPAGVVYLGNYPGFMLSAVYFFRRQVFGSSWTARADKGGFQTPGKAISQVFKSSLWPEDIFDMQVFAGDVRRNTYDALILAKRVDNDRDVFFGRVTSIVVSIEERTRKVAMPQNIRDALEAYRREIPVPQVLLDTATWFPDATVNA